MTAAERPQQNLEDRALDGCQLHGFSATPEFAHKSVELQAARLDDLRLGEAGVARGAQDCANARE